jgi:hypothetical protein
VGRRRAVMRGQVDGIVVVRRVMGDGGVTANSTKFGQDEWPVEDEVELGGPTERLGGRSLSDGH